MEATGEISEAEPISKRRGDNDVADILSAVTITWNPARKLKTDHRSRSPFARRLLGGIIALLILVPLILILFRPDTIEAAWYADGWRFRKLITINHFKVPSTQTDFPVLVSITDAGLKSHAQGTGNDILFTSSDGSTKLKHEIETFATGSGKLNAWVKIPSLSSTTDTQIYMYYGNPSSPNQQDPVNVWDTNFKGVWHMKENPAGAAPQIKDSTTNANNGTSNGSMTASQQTAGQVNGGIEFDGSDDYIDVTDTTILEPSNITMAAWIKSGSTTNQEVVGKQSGVDPWPGYALKINSLGGSNNTDGALTAWVGDKPNDWCSVAMGAGTISNNTWHFLSGTYDGTTVKLYFDGVLKQSCNQTGSIPNANNLRIGTDVNGGLDSNGNIDEVRISSTARPADWITTEYNNQSNPATFLGVGLQAENKNAPVAWYKFDEGQGTLANNSGNCGTTCNATLTSMASPATDSSGWTPNGKFGKALAFDGTDDYVSTGTTISSFIGASNATMSVWLSPTGTAVSDTNSFNGNGAIGDAEGYIGIYRTNISGTNNIWAYNWDGNEDKIGVSYNTNEWTHITLVHTGGTLYIYKNGVLGLAAATVRKPTVRSPRLDDAWKTNSPRTAIFGKDIDGTYHIYKWLPLRLASL